jgi:hypothetical protein
MKSFILSLLRERESDYKSVPIRDLNTQVTLYVKLILYYQKQEKDIKGFENL